ncbi:hypothetical protein TBLA_0B06080 [Henningerozyma blattae CBS 6284]|uniref:Ubiquitin carboxyl-terminal hydrolase n=1 Tax=Henningerozyma blattae (strain ATCC 34711 / CBS 6284 / DSM 70876 / NBRC 10599 / NRRL Y-10934 / UCD 77-7) TaxID=1071380 RepID=I2GZ82_HENB6|nr:hypothetical protein TBLA_0B06080 [Tetrapisispora blattae CBS 6284]CCH59434.1 hypothetical protein TBLA_0B06080 [Tetrapisispora blattae CBS 6284]
MNISCSNDPSGYRKWVTKNNLQIQNTVMKRGGFVGGLVNEGNTCFMNSVLQSLASSHEIVRFLDEEIIKQFKQKQLQELEELHKKSDSAHNHHNHQQDDKKSKNKSYGKRKKKLTKTNDDDMSTDVSFSISLKDLLDKLNDKYYRERKYYRTNNLLKTMSKAPNKNIILGYEQEDAQEFFQTILYELEKNIKFLDSDREKLDKKPIPESDLPSNALIGQNNLSHVGTVYIPTAHLDPNSLLDKDPSTNYFTPFRLVTPLDGIVAERIGCLNCGETGGIRYSVSSGLSLNLPSENIGDTLKLSQLLNEWCKPEIIEGVNCYRCSLNAVLEHLENQLKTMSEKPKGSIPDKLISAIKTRIKALNETLSKPVIDDEEYKKMHTDNMVRKSSKSKQIILARPPPLLSIHINRSVFDTRTFMIKKNNSRLAFKARLNLKPWCCDVNDINLDARLPMSKTQKSEEDGSISSEDETVGGEYYAKLHDKFQKEFEDSDEEQEDGMSDYSDYNMRSNRDVDNYDPLNEDTEHDEIRETVSTTDSEDEYIEETDKLGNTIRIPKSKESENHHHIKRTIVESNDESEELEVEYEMDLNSSSTNESHTEKFKGGSGNVASSNGVNVLPNSDSSEEEEANGHNENVTYSSSSDGDDDEDDDLPPPPPLSLAPTYSTKVPTGPLTYELRSVIVHYGTHNYGHYIAFRKYRGTWWRISDETVHMVDEAEVLSTPSVFMLFYEYDFDEKSGMMKDDLEKHEYEEEEFDVGTESDESSDELGMNEHLPATNEDDLNELEVELTEEANERIGQGLENIKDEKTIGEYQDASNNVFNGNKHLI